MGLIIWISFIDDMLVVCDEKYMAKIKHEFTGTVDCDDTGAMVEYIGTKIDIDNKKHESKITQPVLVQKVCKMSLFLKILTIAPKHQLQQACI